LIFLFYGQDFIRSGLRFMIMLPYISTEKPSRARTRFLAILQSTFVGNRLQFGNCLNNLIRMSFLQKSYMKCFTPFSRNAGRNGLPTSLRPFKNTKPARSFLRCGMKRMSCFLACFPGMMPAALAGFFPSAAIGWNIFHLNTAMKAALRPLKAQRSSLSFPRSACWMRKSTNKPVPACRIAFLSWTRCSRYAFHAMTAAPPCCKFARRATIPFSFPLGTRN